jgi:hypothetical protein
MLPARDWDQSSIPAQIGKKSGTICQPEAIISGIVFGGRKRL